MKDTQWPRYEVFLQTSADRPHEHAGSVHAPDLELALLHARDVFVRRPDCYSLWVTPAEQFLTRTRSPEGDPGAHLEEGEEEFVVFVQPAPRGTLTETGRIRAGSAESALLQASRRFQGFVWGVVPVKDLLASTPEDAEPFFDPARHKPYRHHSFYRTVYEMYRIKRGDSGG